MNNGQDDIKREANVHSWLYGVGITGVISGIGYIFTPGEMPIRLIVSVLLFLLLLFPNVKVVFYFISSGLR
ncbi:hypothetical protein [Citrobacter koseri]|uniref:hypothetical protein n=1 Tax=Citrobacter koseri TaxID=545 RepID=UPI00350FE028